LTPAKTKEIKKQLAPPVFHTGLEDIYTDNISFPLRCSGSGSVNLRLGILEKMQMYEALEISYALFGNSRFR